MSKTVSPKWGKIDKTAREIVAPKTPDEMAEDGKLAYLMIDNGLSMDEAIEMFGPKEYIRKCILHWIVSGDSNIYGDRESL